MIAKSEIESFQIEDIKKDAEKVRVYDHQYDMYLDEFDDFDEEAYIAG